MTPLPVQRTLRRVKSGAPPAVWAAFAAQGRWKSWALLGQQLCLLVLLFVALQLAKTEPDVVLVGADGQGTYVHRTQATKELRAFLAEQRGAPSELTALGLSRRFLKSTLQVNSATFADEWAEGLLLMAPALRAKVAGEATAQRLVEATQLMQLKTRLTFDELKVVERQGRLFHVRAKLQRERSRLLETGAAPQVDGLQVELVLGVVRRTEERPDGLEVLEWRVGPRKDEPTSEVRP